MKNNGSNGYGGDGHRAAWWARLGWWFTNMTASAVIGGVVAKPLEVWLW